MNMYLMIISSNDNDVIDDIVVNMKMVKATVKTRKKLHILLMIFFCQIISGHSMHIDNDE